MIKKMMYVRFLRNPNLLILLKNTTSYILMTVIYNSYEDHDFNIKILAILKLFVLIFMCLFLLSFGDLCSKEKRKKVKNRKISFARRLLPKIYNMIPFFEILFFLNFEILFLKNVRWIMWLCIIRMVEYMARSQLLSFDSYPKKIFGLSIFFVWLNFFMYIITEFEVRYILILFLEVTTLPFLFAKCLYQTDDKLILEKNQLVNSLNSLADGFLCIEEKKDEEYEVAFFNNRLQEIFDIDENCKNFSILNKKINKFQFKKFKEDLKLQETILEIKNEANSLDRFFIQNEESNDLERIISKTKALSRRKKKLSYVVFFTTNHGTSFGLKLRVKFSQEKSLNSKKIINYYYLTFKKIKKKEIPQNNFSLVDDSKNRLLSSFSHELKTPLNGSIPILEEIENIVGYNANIRSPLAQAIASLKLLEITLNNIMDYSLTLSDQFIIHQTNINLENFLGEIFKMMKNQAELKELELTIEITENLQKCSITTDYNRLKQIVVNIMVNAIQFTNKGSIELSVERDLDDPNLILFRILDTGIGMSKEKLENLEVKINGKVDNEFNINSTGSCFGLIMSQNIAKLLGNTGILIESQENVGTEVSFEIYCGGLRDVKDEISSCRTIKTMSVIGKRNTESKIKFTKKYKIFKYSKEILKIRNKNLEIQKSIKENKEKSLPTFPNLDNLDKNFEFEINVSNVIGNYDFDNLKNKTSKFLEKVQSLAPTSFNRLNSTVYEKRKSKLSSFKTLYSYHNCSYEKEKIKENVEESLQNICFCDEVLIVDDDAFNLLSMEMIIKSFNFTVKKALNGQEALDKFKGNFCSSSICRRGFKLIFMDYQMPILDGVETTKKMIEMMDSGLAKKTPIIGCTAFTSKDEVSNCLNAGMKEVIFKPISKNVIENILNDWL